MSSVRGDAEEEVELQEEGMELIAADNIQYLHSLGRKETAKLFIDEATTAGRTTKTSSTERTSMTLSTGQTATTATSASLLDSYNSRFEEEEGEDEADELIPALAWRSYHLPGSSFCEDYFQFFANTHPLFAICCHHPLHPVRWHMRMLQLTGSIVFGLLVTNLIWLFLVYDEQRDADRAVLTISLGEPSNVTNAVPANGNITSVETDSSAGGTTIEVTEGMIFLWTAGGVMHAFYDNLIYYITACVCCCPKRTLSGLRRSGNVLIVFLVSTVAALSSFFVVFRATLSDNEGTNVDELRSAGFSDDQIEPLTGFDDKSSFDFLVTYGVEIAMALFLWYPLVGTVLFVGVLGCGRVPVLGGRPYEMRQAQLRREKKEKRRRRKEQKAMRKFGKSFEKSLRKSGGKRVSLSTLLEGEHARDRYGEHVLLSLPPRESASRSKIEEEEEDDDEASGCSLPKTSSSRCSSFDDDDDFEKDLGSEDVEKSAGKQEDEVFKPRTPPTSRKGRKRNRD